MITLNSSQWCKHLMGRHLDGLHALSWDEKWCRPYTLPPVEWGKFALGPQIAPEVVDCACGRKFLIHAKWEGWCDGKVVHEREKCEPGPFTMGVVRSTARDKWFKSFKA